MVYAHVSPEALKNIEEKLTSATEVKGYRRLKVIHLSAQRKSVTLIAMVLDLCPATVRAYITRYNAHGLTGLQREASPGAPPKISLTKAEWDDLLHQSPSHFEPLHTGARNWTQALLQQYFQAYHQIAVTQPAISASLKRHGIRWNRGKLNVTSPDPLYTVKRDRIDRLKKRPRLAR